MEPFKAWDLWKDGRCVELMDPTLTDSCPLNELMLCIQVGLLCVQEKAEDRSTMSDIVLMLSSGVTLPTPKQPAFSTLLNVDLPTGMQKASQNFVTFSSMEAR